MKWMTGLDATFLYSESESVLMHTLKVAIVDVPDAPGSLYQRLVHVLGTHIHLLPPFTLRAVEVPLGLHHPAWVEDPEFRLENHLRRRTCGFPGSQRELNAEIARIASVPLRRDRPLWELWMIDGLRNGRVAFVAKLHHALADGAASAELLANIMAANLDRGDEPVRRHTESVPGKVELAMKALATKPQQAAELPGLLSRTVKGGLAMLRREDRDHQAQAAIPFDTPRTRFNRTLTPERAFATIDVDLERVLELKRAIGVTVNDVVLSVVGRALERHLRVRDESPDRSLTATVPVGLIPGDDAPRLQGNRLSNLFTSLCTDIDDPIERVRAVHRSMRDAKSSHSAFGPEIMQRWAEFTPSGAYGAGMRLYGKLGIADKVRPAANLIVSNVRGPASEVSIAGARLERFYSVGPLLDGLGLNVTAWSYAGRISFTALGSAEAESDLDPFCERIVHAIEELEACVASIAEPAAAVDLPNVEASKVRTRGERPHPAAA